MYNGDSYKDVTIIDDIRDARNDLDDAEFDAWYAKVGRSDFDGYATESAEKLHPKLIRVVKMLDQQVITKDDIKKAYDLVKAEARKAKQPKEDKKKRERKSKAKKPAAVVAPIVPTENSSVASDKKACRYGDHCKDDKCVLYHTTAKCKDGSQCKRIGGCYFYHPGVSKTSRGQPLISRVAKVLNQKTESMAEMLNGRKQFNMEIASKATFPAFFSPDAVQHTSHGVYFLGCMHMTKHGLDAFTAKNLPNVHFRCPNGSWAFIPVKDFAYCAPDVVFAAIPAGMRPKVRVAYRSPDLCEFANVFSVAPHLKTDKGAIVSIDVKTEHYRYSTATKPGDSGCGIWDDDGKLLGIHTDGSPTTNGGTFVNQRWINLVTGKAGTSSEAQSHPLKY
jgi:hypothetical protein